MRKLIHIFLTIATLGMLGNCGQNEAVTKEVDSTALRLAVMPTMDCLPFYYADSLGLFDSLGVKVRLITFEAAMDADTALQYGHVDGIVTDIVKQCVWQGNGDSLTSVMSADLNLWLVTAQSARLLKETSLKDKIIAITRNSAEDFFADKIMEFAKLLPTELNKPQINKLRLRTLMVDQNQIDGALLPEPYASEAEARGAKRLTSTLSLRLPSMMTVLFPDSICEKRKADVDGIAKVYDMAVEMLNADSLSNRLNFIPEENCVYLPDTLYKPVTYRKSTQTNDSLMQIVKQWAAGRDLIKQTPSKNKK